MQPINKPRRARGQGPAGPRLRVAPRFTQRRKIIGRRLVYLKNFLFSEKLFSAGTCAPQLSRFTTFSEAEGHGEQARQAQCNLRATLLQCNNLARLTAVCHAGGGWGAALNKGSGQQGGGGGGRQNNNGRVNQNVYQQQNVFDVLDPSNQQAQRWVSNSSRIESLPCSHKGEHTLQPST